MAGVDILHVPYKGSAPLVTALLGGEISMIFDTVTSSLPHIKGGKLRPLGVTTAKRSSALPDVPTLAEAAPLPGFDIVSWFGVLAPAATPKEIVARLNTELIKILSIPEVQKRLHRGGAGWQHARADGFPHQERYRNIRQDRQRSQGNSGLIVLALRFALPG
jgi:tripartite-type tricarboxylate transporter receptor subunit TctC